MCGLSSPVLGLHSVGRLTSGRFCRVCLGTGDFLRPQGAIPPGLYPLRGVWAYCLVPEAPQKGECRRGRRYFWPWRTRVGFGPATGPTLKTALCHIRALLGRFDKYRGLHGRSQGPLGSTRLRVLRYRGCTHLTATSSGGFKSSSARLWREPAIVIVRTALTRQSLRSRPIRPHGLGARQSTSLSSTRSLDLVCTKARQTLTSVSDLSLGP